MKGIRKSLVFVMFAIISLMLFRFRMTASVYVGSANGIPIIDGIMDDLWYSAELIPITNPILGNVSPEADMRMLWRDNSVYFFIRVFDKDVSFEGDSSEKDGITLWLNPLNTRVPFSFTDGQLRVIVTAPADAPVIVESMDTTMTEVNGGIKKAYVKTDFGYIIELSVDLSLLENTFSVTSGSCIGCDIWVTNQTSNDKKKVSVISAFGFHGNEGETLTDTVIFTVNSHSTDTEEQSDPPKQMEDEREKPPVTADLEFTMLFVLISSFFCIFVLSLKMLKFDR